MILKEVIHQNQIMIFELVYQNFFVEWEVIKPVFAAEVPSKYKVPKEEEKDDVMTSIPSLKLSSASEDALQSVTAQAKHFPYVYKFKASLYI